jgi:hypothetical protein
LKSGEKESGMRYRFKGGTIAAVTAAAAVSALVSLSVTRTAGQVPGKSQPSRQSRVADGKPNFNGIWQALNEAHWDLEAHEARPGMVTQPGVYPYDYARVPAAPVLALGSVAGIPGSLGVVQGDGRIPYKAEALAIKKEHAEHWIDRDPELKCYMPGVPRAMYMPYRFQIIQGTSKIHMSFEFSATARIIHLDTVEKPPTDLYMGHSVGRWEGDTLVVDSTHFNDKTWFDRAGNFHSDAMTLVERFTPMSPDAIHYEVTITDPKVFTRPWTISMPLYRRLEPDAQLLNYRCIEFAEEFLYGHLRRQQLVRHWEGETLVVDIKRKVPPGEQLYEQIGR